jgi:hypothetical protein
MAIEQSVSNSLNSQSTLSLIISAFKTKMAFWKKISKLTGTELACN